MLTYLLLTCSRAGWADSSRHLVAQISNDMRAKLSIVVALDIIRQCEILDEQDDDVESLRVSTTAICIEN